MTSIDRIIDYILRILPGLACAVLFLLALPRKALAVRMMSYLLIFIIIRDSMTPLGFWSIGTQGFFWIRFDPDTIILLVLGCSSAAIIWGMNVYEKDLKSLIVWFSGSKVMGVAAGIAGGFVVALPLIILYQWVPVSARGGAVPRSILPMLLVVTLIGNLYEETLFRGFFFGYLEKHIGVAPLKAAFLSGLMFSFGHVFLATTVTAIGYPLLVFTFYEGVVAGLLRMKYGLVAAALAHGTAIWLLASGLF